MSKVALMRSLRLTHFSLLFSLLRSVIVVAQNDWSVNYTRNYICAVRGSTVTMGCSYKPDSTNSTNFTVHHVYWSKYLLPNSKSQDLSSDPAYKGRVQYLRETPTDCSLRMRNIVQEDQLKYYITLKTSAVEVSQDKHGVELSVTALRVEMIPDRVFEGDKVTMKCVTSCLLTETPTFTWYKHGRNFSSIHSSDLLHLQSVSQKSTGDYHCTIRENSYRSPDVILNVLSKDRRGSAKMDAGHLRNFLVAVGVILCGFAVLLPGLYYMRRKRQKASDSLNAAEDMYTPPDPTSRSSNDMYNTLGNVYANSANDTYTALDIQTRSSSDVYNTLAAVHPSPPNDTYTAPDSWIISPDYGNVPARI